MIEFLEGADKEIKRNRKFPSWTWKKIKEGNGFWIV